MSIKDKIRDLSDWWTKALKESKEREMRKLEMEIAAEEAAVEIEKRRRKLRDLQEKRKKLREARVEKDSFDFV